MYSKASLKINLVCINTFVLFCGMKRNKAKKVFPKGKNIRIPDEQFKLIKEYCDEQGLIMGKFIAHAAITQMPEKYANRL